MQTAECEKTNQDMTFMNAVDKSSKVTGIVDSPVEHLRLPIESCQVPTESGSANGRELTHVDHLFKPVDAVLLNNNQQASDTLVDLRDSVASIVQGVTDAAQHRMEHAISPTSSDTRTEREIRLDSPLAPMPTHLKRSDGIPAVQDVFVEGEVKSDEVMPMQEEVSPPDTTPVLMEADTVDITRSTGWLYISTQAALVQARDEFHEGLDSPDKSISASSVSTPIHLNYDTQHRTPGMGADAGVKSVHHSSNIVDDAGVPPMNTQDLFADAPDFCFSTEKKTKKFGRDDRRISFAPSPLVRQITGEHGNDENNDDASIDEDITMTDLVPDVMHANSSITENTPLFKGVWVKHGFERTPFQSAQADADLESMEIEAIVDDTLSFLDNWNMTAEAGGVN